MSMSKSPVEPMEAKLVADLPADDGWQFEPKWDGFRCIAIRRGEDVALFAKSGKVLHRYFPEVVAALAELEADDFVLDGELIIPVKRTVDFDALQQRLHPAESRVRKLSVETPATFIMFDLLQDEQQQSLLDEPLLTRRELLETFARQQGPVHGVQLSPATQDVTAAEVWFGTTGGGLDGIIAKNLMLPYASILAPAPGTTR